MVKRALLLLFLILGLGTSNFVQATEPLVQNGREIRVAISTSDFKTNQYKEITLSATSVWQVYDSYDNKIIAKFPPNQEATFVLKGGMFDITSGEYNISDMISGPLIVTTTGQGLLKVKGLTRANKEALYRGIFILDKVANKIDTFYLVNQLNLQQYLYGVVPNEMPVSFGLEALKAQSVAARNYVLKPRTNSQNKQYDVTDSVSSQVYFGANTEKAVATQAVNETNNIVAMYNGQIILALYHSTSGGITEDYENAFNRPGTKIFPANPLPYLKAVSDIANTKTLELEDDAIAYYTSRPQSFEGASPYFRWTREWTKEELEQVLNQTIKAQLNSGFVAKMMPYPDEIGELKDIKILQRGKSGKIVKMSIIGSQNVFMVEKELIIRNLFKKDNSSLPSANVVFKLINDEDGNLSTIKAYGGGFGHGVGMSQFGAGYMSKIGKTFRDILFHYYKDIYLATIPVNLASDKVETITQEFYTTNENALLKVENLKSTDKLKIRINSTPDIKLNTGSTPQKVLTYKLYPYVKLGKNTITYQIYEPTTFKNNIRLYIQFDNSEVPAK